MRPYLSLLLVLIGCSSLAQIEVEEIEDDSTLYLIEREEEGIIGWTEEGPTYPGGEVVMMKFISDSLIYPQKSVELGEEGIVYIRFDIDEKGYLSNYKIVRGSYPLLDNEAMRVVKLFPKKWSPYKFAGEAKSTSFTIPIRFVLKSAE